MILGTAGHVDHGKTTLVRLLTGVDTDRLAEEKRRGITIELGFAPLRIGDRVFGIVDVPGHEAFVRNMLAGATGVDLALLVIAADEGVMAQTREHLAILTLLGIRGGVVALTKVDLVDDDWRELVLEDVRSTLAGTPLENATVVATAAESGVGIEGLRDAIAAAASDIPSRDARDVFRMPVDRAFSVRGTGTVVTGTVWSGTLGRDDSVRIMPSGQVARVRGLESHGAVATSVGPGTRAAIALGGVELDAVARGVTIVSGGGWEATRLILADVALLDTAPAALGPRTAVRFHLGTADTGARIVAGGGPIRPGERRAARIVLDEPVVARAGDRFVIRAASPLVTVGGGVVEDPLPGVRRARPWSQRPATANDRLTLLLDTAGRTGLELAQLPIRVGVPPAEADLLVSDARVVALAERVYATSVVDALVGRLTELLDEYHRSHPLDPGASLQAMRVGLEVEPALAAETIRRATESHRVEIAGALVHRPGWSPTLTSAQSSARESLLRVIDEAGREPPSVTELEASHGRDTAALLRDLERGGEIVAVEGDRYWSRSAVGGMVAALRSALEPGREYSPAELRDVLGLSRKFMIPFLEYCDRIGITERRTSGRTLAPRREVQAAN